MAIEQACIITVGAYSQKFISGSVIIGCLTGGRTAANRDSENCRSLAYAAYTSGLSVHVK